MVGNIIAYELGTLNIDLSFTPVLDLDYGKSKVISDRSFPFSRGGFNFITELIKKLDEMGFKNVAKHFSGHGFVEVDLMLIYLLKGELTQTADLKPYIKNINKIDAVMTAHIIYKVLTLNQFVILTTDKFYIRKVWFKGLIISDDLLMKVLISEKVFIKELVIASKLVVIWL